MGVACTKMAKHDNPGYSLQALIEQQHPGRRNEKKKKTEPTPCGLGVGSGLAEPEVKVVLDAVAVMV